MENQLSTELTGALAELNEGLAEEAVGYNAQMVVIKINHPDQTFNIPSLPSVQRLEGVVLASRRARALFPKMGSQAATDQIAELCNNRPFCSSQDYEHGEIIDITWDDIDGKHPARMIKEYIGQGGLTCRVCPLNQWESVELFGKEGRGKACGEMRRLLLWRQGIQIPQLLSVPVSSIRAWDAYCSSLDAAGFKHHLMVTEIGLEPKGSGARQYSGIIFRADGQITEAMAEELTAEVPTADGMKKLWMHLRDVFHGRDIEASENAENGATTEGDEL